MKPCPECGKPLIGPPGAWYRVHRSSLWYAVPGAIIGGALGMIVGLVLP